MPMYIVYTSAKKACVCSLRAAWYASFFDLVVSLVLGCPLGFFLRTSGASKLFVALFALI